MEVFATGGLPARMRAPALSKFHQAQLGPATFTADDPDRFAGEMKVGVLGSLRIAALDCGRARIVRPPVAGGTADRSYTVLCMVRGGGQSSHYGHLVALRPGDVTLYDEEAPHSLTLDQEGELLLLRVPAAMLKEHLPARESLCGRRLPGDEGLTSTAVAMALSLVTQIEAGFPSPFQDRVARHLLDVIATAYAVAFGAFGAASSVVSGRHATVKLYIEQHLRDPDLSPCSIATRLKLSSRYLRMIFATSSETVSAYVLRRRLEECARQIGDPAWRGYSMTEIAFSWGFNSAPHFTRSFRDRYAMSPREYRRAKLEEHDDVVRPATRAMPATACAA